MKRLLTLILITLLCIGFCDAENLDELSLDELYILYGNVLREIGERNMIQTDVEITCEGEIKFRGFAWDIDAQSFEDTMREQGIHGSSKETTLESWETETSFSYSLPAARLKDGGYKYSATQTGINVGGYEVDTVDAFFLHTYDDDGVSDKKSDSNLYYAAYWFSSVLDKQAAYNDLVLKLSSLYGTPQKFNESKSGTERTEFCQIAYWYGANNTGVRLWYYYRTDNKTNEVLFSNMILKYGRTDSIVMLKALEAAMAREELKSAQGNVDGL